MAGLLHHEDLEVGRDYPLGSRRVTAEDIVGFASVYDPQPFHLDDAAARDTILGGLAASGWHTAGVMMRLYVDGLLARTASMGSPGIEALRWRRPVRPGDTLTGTVRIRDKRVSRSRPGMGILAVTVSLDNQQAETVLEMRATLLCATRAGAR